MSLKQESFKYFDANPTANAADAKRDIGLSNSAFYSHRKQWKLLRAAEKQRENARIIAKPAVVEDKRNQSMIELMNAAKTFVQSCGDSTVAKEALDAYFTATS